MCQPHAKRWDGAAGHAEVNAINAQPQAAPLERARSRSQPFSLLLVLLLSFHALLLSFHALASSGRRVEDKDKDKAEGRKGKGGGGKGKEKDKGKERRKKGKGRP